MFSVQNLKEIEKLMAGGRRQIKFEYKGNESNLKNARQFKFEWDGAAPQFFIGVRGRRGVRFENRAGGETVKIRAGEVGS